VSDPDAKHELQSYLRGARDTLVWKLDGLSDYDIRRPMTPSGTNLLGLIKHSTATHMAYFGEVFGRSFDGVGERFAPGAEPASEFWATAGESRQDVLDRYRSACDRADATIEELPLETPGRVRWWGDTQVTLHHVLVHVIADTQRHAGHADILRELIDGTTGLLRNADNLHMREPAARQRFHDQVAAEAAKFL
jgi:uncharacterized damage-inducible protein DinB